MELLLRQFVDFPAFVITWLTFLIAGVITFLIQLYRNRQVLSPSAFLRHCFPFDFWSAKTVHMDIKIYVIRKFTDFLFIIPSASCTVAISKLISNLLGRIFPDYLATQPSYLILMGCCIVVFFVAEFSDYVIHYLEHKIPVLWELHKIHHSALLLNPLTTKRSHSFPILYGGIVGGTLSGIPAGIFAFLFGLSLTETLFLAAIGSKIGTLATLDPLKHSHFPVTLGWFDRILISPHMHQVHHSSLPPHLDKNFGTNLSIFDWVFGTAYKPSKDEAIVYGLNGYDRKAMQQFDSLLGVYIRPLLKVWRMVAPQPFLGKVHSKEEKLFPHSLES